MIYPTQERPPHCAAHTVKKGVYSKLIYVERSLGVFGY